MYVALMILFLCCAGQFLYAGSETGFVSWNPLKISHHAARGGRIARWALFISERKDRLLSATLIGNNVCVVGSSLAFMAIFARIDSLLTAVNLSRIQSVESIILAPLLVVFCEMLPKSLFRVYSFRLTLRTVPLLMFTYWITWPVTALISLGYRLLGAGSLMSQSLFVTRRCEQMLLVAKEGVRRGTLYEGADVPIRAILNMSGKRIRDIAGQADAGADCILRVHPGTTVSRLRPDLRNKQNEQLVLISAADGALIGGISMLDVMSAEAAFDVEKLARPIPVISADAPAISLLQSPAPSFRRFFRMDTGTAGEYRVLDRLRMYQALFGGIVDDADLSNYAVFT